MRPSTSFFCTELNATTFLIIEDDSYDEHPHIYVKIYSNLILISDTGCNSPRQDNKSITSLRQYLETYPVPSNDESPLNPNGTKPYLIICTHCHYDHILGIPPFLTSRDPNDSPTTTTTIIASSHSKSFILDDLPTHSLCKALHIPTPSYQVSIWATHLSYLSYSAPSSPLISTRSPPQHLRIQFLHIPGHTPDSLAWYDIDAHHLYVGDTFYARRRSSHDPSSSAAFRDRGSAPPSLSSSSSSSSGTEVTTLLPAIVDASIIFPTEGNLICYLSSLSLLLSFVRHQNILLEKQWRSIPAHIHKHEPEHEHNHKHDPDHAHDNDSKTLPPPTPPPPRVLLGSGHVTSDGDAEDMTHAVQTLFWGIVRREVEVRRSDFRRGEWFDYWVEPGAEDEEEGEDWDEDGRDGNEDGRDVNGDGRRRKRISSSGRGGGGGGDGERCERGENGGRYSVLAPRRLVEEARAHFGLKGLD